MTAARASSLTDLLGALTKAARRPLENAITTPPKAYSDPAFFELEKEKVLAPEWHCAGRALDLKEPGDYLTYDIAGEACFAIMDNHGRHRAYSNICRHRLAKLLSGSGRVQRIVCPYHAWNYDLEGQLKSAPFMAEDFDPSGICLNELGLEIWHGWHYINLDRNAPPLAPRLAGLERSLANYRMERFLPLFRREEVWDTNWKCLIENFNESYHLFQVHSQSVEPALPTRLTSNDEPGGPGYSIFYQERIPGVAYEYDKVMEPANEALSEDEKNLHPLFFTYPTHSVALSPERAFWISLQPLGSERVKMLWGVDVYPGSFPEGEEGERQLARLAATLEQINEEDKDIVAGVRANAASRFAVSGTLSPMERSLWEFQRYLARRLELLDEAVSA